MPDELVFSVAGSTADPAQPITLFEAGLLERQHLQEWVLGHPEILGSGVMVVTFEFDRWRTRAGTPERDRLDVLGLDRDGHLVVAELKRDQAPDTVEMQAIKYAAMASRFTPDDLAEYHAIFLAGRGTDADGAGALDILMRHTNYSLTLDTIREPRIVLLATGYPTNVTATTVWLSEIGLDITLMRFQAYRTTTEIIVTVSQLYPVPDVESFTIGPRAAIVRGEGSAAELPSLEWSQEDFDRLALVVSNPTVRTVLDLCANQAEERVPFSEIRAAAGRSVGQARGDLAGLTMMIKHRFGRRNWPITIDWAAGGDAQMYYWMPSDLAERWIRASTSGGEASTGNEE